MGEIGAVMTVLPLATFLQSSARARRGIPIAEWVFPGNTADMPRTSLLAADTIRNVNAIARDASNAASLAERLLAALQPVLKFDDAEVLAVDSESLLFTRLLAYHGERLPHFAFFLRDVYL